MASKSTDKFWAIVSTLSQPPATTVNRRASTRVQLNLAALAGRGFVVASSVALAMVTTLVLGIIISIGNSLPEIVTRTITVILIALFAILLPPALYLIYKIYSLRSIVFSSETPSRYRFAVVATGLYLISPFDPVPLVLVDDLALLIFTYRFIKGYADGVSSEQPVSNLLGS